MDTAATTRRKEPELEALAVPLREMSKRAKGLFAQQAALTAAKQEVTRELNELIKEGNAQVDFIKTGARVRYGKDSEKLVEFGVQPFRTRSRRRRRAARLRRPRSAPSRRLMLRSSLSSRGARCERPPAFSHPCRAELFFEP